MCAEPEICETLRQYRDELAAQGAGTNQSHALAMDRAADEIEKLRKALDHAADYIGKVPDGTQGVQQAWREMAMGWW